jgi:PilZ domain-containing protein
MANLNLSNDPVISRRRSQRVIMSIPVTVKWRGPDGQQAEETTASLVLNAHGALLALANAMKEGQTLRLVNRTTDQEQECRVVYLGPVSSGKAQVGLEFLEPAPEFWNITFPPENWTAPGPASRKPRAH